MRKIKFRFRSDQVSIFQIKIDLFPTCSEPYFVTNKNVDDLDTESQVEAVKKSENMKDLCLICGLAENTSAVMVECTWCQRWIHCPCINVSVEQVKKDDNFKCPVCVSLNCSNQK